MGKLSKVCTIVMVVYLCFQFYSLIRIPKNWKIYSGINSIFTIHGGMYINPAGFVETVDQLILDGYEYVPQSLLGETITMRKEEIRFPFSKESEVIVSRQLVNLEGDTIAKIDLKNQILVFGLAL